MKPKLKLSDFWYYYKWYFLFAFLVLWVIFNFLSERSQIVEPDAIVSFVTLEELSPETLSRLQQTVTTHAEDTNKDGRIEVEINVYAYDGQGSDGTDPEGYAAAAVHLASEIQLQTTSFFVTNLQDLFQESDTLEQKGVWGDYAALWELGDATLADFQIYAFPDQDALLAKLK